MRNLWIGLLGSAALMLAGAGSASAQVVIDDFSVETDQAGNASNDGDPGNEVLFANGSNPSVESFDQGPSTSIIGGERDVILSQSGSVDDNIGAEFAIVNVGGFGSVGSLDVDSGVSANMELQYDGVDGSSNFDPDGLVNMGVGVDLASEGNSFVFVVVFSDQVGAQVDITVTSPGGGISTFSQTLMFTVGDTGTLPAGFPVPAPFAAFSGNADFSNVGGIRIELTGAVALDLQIDEIAVVPEPGTLGLFGTGLLAMGWFARRHHRRRKAA